MTTEAHLEAQWPKWTGEQIWSAPTVQRIHQELFSRLPEEDRTLTLANEPLNLIPGA